MFERKKQPQTNDSLEQRLKPGLGGKLAAGALALWMAGCNATNYWRPPEDSQAYTQYRDVVNMDYDDLGTPDVETLQEVVNGLYGENLQNVQRVNLDYNTLSDQQIEEMGNALPEDERGTYRAMLQKINGMNRTLKSLFDNAGIQRYTLRVALDGNPSDGHANVDFEALEFTRDNVSREQYEQIVTQINQVISTLNDSTAGNGVTADERNYLGQHLGQHDEHADTFNEMMQYNARALADLRNLILMSADAQMHEGNLRAVDQNLERVSSIDRSLYNTEDMPEGYDHYAAGAQVLDQKVLPKSVEDVFIEDHPFRDSYDSNDGLRGAFDELRRNITDESRNAGEGTLHEIATNYGFKMLSIAQQAHQRGLINNQEFISANRYIMSEIADAVDDGAWETRGGNFNVWTDVILPILPISGIVNMGLSARRAFSPDDYEPASNGREGLVQLIEDGAFQRLGYGTGTNFKGSTGPAQLRFWIGAGTTALYAAGGILYGAGVFDSGGGNGGANGGANGGGGGGINGGGGFR